MCYVSLFLFFCLVCLFFCLVFYFVLFLQSLVRSFARGLISKRIVSPSRRWNALQRCIRRATLNALQKPTQHTIGELKNQPKGKTTKQTQKEKHFPHLSGLPKNQSPKKRKPKNNKNQSLSLSPKAIHLRVSEVAPQSVGKWATSQTSPTRSPSPSKTPSPNRVNSEWRDLADLAVWFVFCVLGMGVLERNGHSAAQKQACRFSEHPAFSWLMVVRSD